MKTKLISLICIATIAISCNSEYVAKPRAYFKIELPDKKYQAFNDPQYPYSFEYPVYGKVIQ
ncbi:MAG: hypothetical protein ACXWCZ_05415, partial [Flavisolibacter sp.]